MERGNLTIEYCPTAEMVVNYFTKPLQGNLFDELKKRSVSTKGLDLCLMSAWGSRPQLVDGRSVIAMPIMGRGRNVFTSVGHSLFQLGWSLFRFDLMWQFSRLYGCCYAYMP